MSFGIYIKGGTNRIRVVKALAKWTCEVCGHETDKFSCPNACGTRRPE